MKATFFRSKLWSRPPQGNLEEDERKQYRDHSPRNNEFQEPWIEDNAAEDLYRDHFTSDGCKHCGYVEENGMALYGMSMGWNLHIM